MASLMRTSGGSTRSSSDLPSWSPFEMMRQMLEWDPFRQLGAGAGSGRDYSPPFDVKEQADRFIFKADLPGVEEKDLDINVAGNRLTISGRRAPEQPQEGECWYCSERPAGSFTRVFTLPEGVQAEHVEAALQQGVLVVHVPKAPEVQPRRISISSSLVGFGDKVKSLLENRETAAVRA